MNSAISWSRPRLVLKNTLLFQAGRRPSGTRFRAATTARSSNQPDEKRGDVMSDSYGEGYASRCDEEGFGGVSGGAESISDIGKDDESPKPAHPDYDKTQGSEVRERERARNQSDWK